MAELVGICGGTLVVLAGEKLTETQVAAADPEVIILVWAATGSKADPAQAYNVAGWKDVTAIQNRRVHVIRDELLNTPGPPLAEGVRELWRLLHPPNRNEHKT